MTTPPPPFDPELAAALLELGDAAPTTATPESIPMAREQVGALVALMTNEELSCGGLFDVQERAVPGPPGAPDVSLLICRPTSVPGPRPIVYFTHPGGMVVGTNRLGLPLDWAEELGLVVVSVEYRLAPSTRTPRRSRTATRDCSGRRHTPRRSAATRIASSWREAARAADSPRPWPCSHATARALVPSASC